MRIEFICKDPESNPDNCPSVYRTDRDSWIIQGWVVSDAEAPAEMAIPEGESAVEIPDRLLRHFFRQEQHGAS
jgi:hypothetical protein